MKENMRLENGILRIRVPEELDHHSAAQISAQADALIKSLMEDQGMLMGRYKMMQALGGTVRAVEVQSRVERILLLSGVMKMIPVERMKRGERV